MCVWNNQLKAIECCVVTLEIASKEYTGLHHRGNESKEEKQIILHFFTKGDFLRLFRTLRNETRRVTNTTTWNEQSSKRKNQRLECGDTRYKSPLLAAVVGWSFNLHQQPYKNTKNKPNQKRG